VAGDDFRAQIGLFDAFTAIHQMTLDSTIHWVKNPNKSQREKKRDANTCIEFHYKSATRIDYAPAELFSFSPRSPNIPFLKPKWFSEYSSYLNNKN